MADKRKREVSMPKAVGIPRQDQRVLGEILIRIQLAGTGVVVPVPRPKRVDSKLKARISELNQLSPGPKPGSK